jgi:hypothetical protein
MMQKKSWQQSSPEVSAEADSIKLSAAELNLIRNISDKVESDDFKSSDTHVFALHNTLVRHYGADWVEWLPETLWRQLAIDHFIASADEMPRETRDKILALQLALATNRPWVEFEVFENVATAFDGDVPSPYVIEPRTAEECLLAMHCLKTIRQDEEFSPEVLIYVASCFASDGLVHTGPARCLDGVQNYLDKFIYDHELSARTQKVFAQLWAQRDTIAAAQLANAENDPLKVQLRKLYGIYTYWEKNYGLDAKPA